MRHTGVLTALLPLAVHATFPLSKQHPLIARVNQPYSWSISPLTFDNANSSATLLRTSPDWLVYDNATSTFRGTPTSEDIGVTTVRIRNQFGESDHFQLCVSDHPSPIVNIPLASQLVPGNPSISSGFTFSAPNIGVRVPPKWSFSIGFDGFTFTSPDERNVYYDATLADGLPLPGWVVFNNRSLTFDGVAPPTNHNPKLSIMLHGSDRWGFGATHEQFDLIIGPRTHLVGVDGTGGLETVNVTAGIPFIHSIKTFGGLVIDGVPLVAANISRVEVNVSAVSWATFNSSTRILSGFPPVSAIGQPDFVFPVSITSDYNDTVDTNISVAVFPSYFTATPIQPMTVTLGSFAMFSLREYFSRARSSSATIVPEYVPRAAASWLNYDNSSGTLRGLVPRSATYNEVNVTFYATDVETHAMSTTSLLLSISSNETYGPEVWGHRHGPDVSQRAKTVIIVIFTVLGGAILLCCLLAICRCYCGVREPREDDEKSSQWKGRDIISPGAQHIGFSKEMMRSAGSSRASDDTVVTFGDGFKLPVSVVLPPQSSSPDPGHRPTSMKRVHFFQRLLTPSKRKLGDQSLGSQSGKIRRSQISRPTLISDGGTLERMQIIVSENGPRLDTEKNPSQHGEQHALGSSAVLNSIPSFGWPRVGPTAQGLPFEGSTHVKIDRSSQVLSESDESSLTSIPRRRSDFLPPRGQQMVCGDHSLEVDPYSDTYWFHRGRPNNSATTTTYTVFRAQAPPERLTQS
jgi:axial budding pattern protein 2